MRSMFMTYKTSGVILREVNTKDSDKMLTVLTPDLGKIRVSAKHIRNSKKNSGAMFLNYSEFELAKGNDIYFLRHSNTIESFYELSEDIKALALATYLAQLASEVVPEGIDSSDTLSLLLNTYYVLAKKRYDLKTAKLIFEIKLLDMQGMLPDFSGCYECGKVSEELYFDLLSGTVNCIECKKSGIELSASCLELINYVTRSPAKKIFSFSASGSVINFLSEIFEKYTALQIGRTLKSLEYYNSIL